LNKGQSAAMRSFRRVREFLDAHPPVNATPNFLKKVAELDDVMSSMSQQADEQNTGKRLTAGESKRQSALRATLWDDHLAPIAELARAIFGVPGVKETLKLPKKTADNDLLLEAASGMANAAEAEKSAFIAYGLPEDFVDQLRAATKALADALVGRDKSTRRHVKATAAVKDQVKRGSRAVLGINAILRPTLKRNPDLKAAWKSAKTKKGPVGGGSTAAGVTLAPAAPVAPVAQQDASAATTPKAA